MDEDDSAILFDKDCKLCNTAVKFLKGKNITSRMAFFPVTSRESEKLIQNHNIPKELTDKTVILLDNGKIFIKSTAIIKALQKKGGLWKLTGIFRIVPLFIRDTIYDWIALNR